MDPNTFPTKGNLIAAKKSLALAKQGYELMDKKRNKYGGTLGSYFPQEIKTTVPLASTLS